MLAMTPPMMGSVPLAMAHAMPTCEHEAPYFCPMAVISLVSASSCGRTGLYCGCGNVVERNFF